MKRPRGHLLDGSIHPLDLPIGPGMEGFVSQPVTMTDHIEDMRLVGLGSRLLRKLHAVIRQHGVGAVR